jgi:beta-1,4-mannosyl-glycoprotein beta-1,4-N-acetylglucosaminyltransferase
MRKIYDCFNFFNELDILDIRLNTLYDHVDYFVIVESSVKHNGEEKPFYFEENKERYSKFLDKIIHYKVYDTPMNFQKLHDNGDETVKLIYNYINIQTNRFNRNNQPDYGRDFYQKESVRRPLVNCQDDDIILISDADEIPNPEVIKNIDNIDLENSIYSLNQYTYYYYINCLKQKDWYGTKMGLYKNVKKHSFNEIRGDQNLTTELDNGGWHFSFMGGEEMVKNKLLSYSARDMVNGYVIDSVESNINNGIDPFFRSRLEMVDIDDTYPKYILDNLKKYKHMIK